MPMIFVGCKLNFSLPMKRYPDQEVPTMQPAVVDFFRACSRLALTLLELMGHALKIHVSYNKCIIIIIGMYYIAALL